MLQLLFPCAAGRGRAALELVPHREHPLDDLEILRAAPVVEGEAAAVEDLAHGEREDLEALDEGLVVRVVDVDDHDSDGRGGGGEERRGGVELARQPAERVFSAPSGDLLVLEGERTEKRAAPPLKRAREEVREIGHTRALEGWEGLEAVASTGCTIA